MKLFIFLALSLSSFSAFTCEEKICIGERIHVEKISRGVVLETYKNKTARVQVDGEKIERFFDFKDMGVFTSCFKKKFRKKELCIGNKVNVNNIEFGLVEEVYTDGFVAIVKEGFNSKRTYLYPVSDVGLLVEEDQGFSIGTRFLLKNNEAGTIQEVFSNGNARVYLDSFLDLEFVYKISDLSII